MSRDDHPNSLSEKRLLRQPLILAGALGGLWLAFFGSVLTGQRSFAFRDASHFYYPLFQWAQNEWRAGRVPLWNPQENCGVPVLAETAASILYPPKLLLFLPGDFAWRYNLYIALHVLLAAATAWLLARRLRASVLASGLCGLSYAFGGNVLFQYCNVVFLVGASWLPLALLTGMQLIRRRQWPWAVGLGSVLALMTLGGDPQAAYHAGLLVALYALLRHAKAGRRRRRYRRLGSACPSPRKVSRPASTRFSLRRTARNRWFLLGLAAAWGLALAAVQILPAAQWTRHSHRAARNAPRNLIEVLEILPRALDPVGDHPAGEPLSGADLSEPNSPEPNPPGADPSGPNPFSADPSGADPSGVDPSGADPSGADPSGADPSGADPSGTDAGPRLPPADASPPPATGRTILQGLAGPLEPGGHHAQVFEFSIAPWRWSEFFWPNCSGRMFPVHRRWLNVIPAEGRVWNPSLYIGLLPLVLALVTWRPWSQQTSVRWLSWTVLLFGLASCGWYGLGWLGRETYVFWFRGQADQFPVGAPVGGVYWLLTVLLPGYVYFRYPAKLMVVASLALSVLAARGWDRILTGPPCSSCPADPSRRRAGGGGRGVGGGGRGAGSGGRGAGSGRWAGSGGRGVGRGRWAGSGRAVRHWLVGLSGVSGVGLVLLFLGRSTWAAWMERVSPDPLFGPLDIDGAWHDLVGALLQTLCLALLLVWRLRHRALGRSVSRSARFGGGLLLPLPLQLFLLTCIDLYLAHGWSVVSEPAALWRRPSSAASPAGEAGGPEAGGPETATARVFRASLAQWRPSQWARRGDPDRLGQIVAWERDTLFPKFQLLQDLALTEAYGTLGSADLRAYFRVARQQGWRREDGVGEPHLQALRWLNTEYLLLPAGTQPPTAPGEPARLDQIPPLAPEASAGAPPADLVVFRDRQRFPRAWIVHEVRQISELRDRSPRARESRTRQVLFPDGRPLDLRRQAVIESDLPLDLPGSDAAKREPDATVEPDGAEQPTFDAAAGCRILSAQPQRVELEADLPRPGLLVLSDLYTEDWRATVSGSNRTSHEVPVLRANRIMRGVPLPAGRCRVVFRYRPRAFYWGGGISGLAWSAAAVVGCRALARRRKRSGAPAGGREAT